MLRHDGSLIGWSRWNSKAIRNTAGSLAGGCIGCGLVLLLAGVASAQTQLVTATSKFQFQASPDHSATFGGVAIVTNYTVTIYPKSAVTCAPTCVEPASGGTVFNAGKPTSDAMGNLTTVAVLPALSTPLTPNTDYLGFIKAVGPGGSSGSWGVGTGSSPFGVAGSPRAGTGTLAVVP